MADVISHAVIACSTIIYDCESSCNVLTASLIFQDFFPDVNVISRRSGFQWNYSNKVTSVSSATTLTLQCSAKSIAHLTISVSASSLQFLTVCLSAIKNSESIFIYLTLFFSFQRNVSWLAFTFVSSLNINSTAPLFFTFLRQYSWSFVLDPAS